MKCRISEPRMRRTLFQRPLIGLGQPSPAKFAAETFKHEKAKLDQPIYGHQGQRPAGIPA